MQIDNEKELIKITTELEIALKEKAKLIDESNALASENNSLRYNIEMNNDENNLLLNDKKKQINFINQEVNLLSYLQLEHYKNKFREAENKIVDVLKKLILVGNNNI